MVMTAILKRRSKSSGTFEQKNDLTERKWRFRFEEDLKQSETLTTSDRDFVVDKCNDQQSRESSISTRKRKWIRCCSSFDDEFVHLPMESNTVSATECLQCGQLVNFVREENQITIKKDQILENIEYNLQHGHFGRLIGGEEIQLEYVGLYRSSQTNSIKLKRLIKILKKASHSNVAMVLGEMYRDGGQNKQRIRLNLARTSNIIELRYLVWKRPEHWTPLWNAIHGHDRKITWSIKLSLIKDLIQGMKFLHKQCPIPGHGRLNSRNCLLDETWRLKIYNFHTEPIDIALVPSNSARIFDLWMAPEVLRTSGANFGDDFRSQDVYSFGMLIYEILTQKIPFSDYFGNENDVILTLRLIKNFGHEQDQVISTMDLPDILKHEPLPLRPKLCRHLTTKRRYQLMDQLMRRCWNEDPGRRPPFDLIEQHFRQAFPNVRINLFEHLVEKLNQSRNLIDEQVRKRTRMLMEEKQKSDELLYKIFPVVVARRLRDGQYVKPEMYENVTLMFSDIVGFTTIASYSKPVEIIIILNNLFSMFDNILKKFDVYKVETIGDAYMVVSGLPIRNTNHAEQIAMVALELVGSCINFTIDHMPNVPLRIRVGIHTGGVASGVVGHTNPRYCLFGDSVNIAARLESTGYPNSIHMSPSTEAWLKKSDSFIIQYRGDILLPGRGELPTYWLLGRKLSSPVESDAPQMDQILLQPPCSRSASSHGISNELQFTSIGLIKQQI